MESEIEEETPHERRWGKKVGIKGYRYVKEWHDLPVAGRRFLSTIGIPLPQAETTRAVRRKLVHPSL
ncbi:MAG: hypothetical protein LYZ66_02825 [Nitrososphaerales archaeon]|nr:hypothetical protein [Nitrososphaerales archaeon]